MSDQKIMQALQEKLQASVPRAIEKALSSYEQFARMEDWDDPRSFAAYHSGCKAALAHLDSLTKIIKFADQNTDKKQEKEKLSQLKELIQGAQETIHSYDERHGQ